MNSKTNQRIAIIRLKGEKSLKVDIRKTFRLLRLYRKNNCVIVPNTPEFVGMLKRVRDSATWGELDKETCKLLLEKRGKLPANKKLTEAYLKEKIKMSFDEFIDDFMNFKKEIADIPGMKKFFKLTPPRKGFERKGVKVPYSLGGALGYRKGNINELIARMV